MKKVIFLLTAFVMMFAHTVTAQVNIEIDGVIFPFTLNDPANGEATLQMHGKGNSDYEGEITVPSEFTYEGNTYTVTSIGENAFKGSKATRVNLPSTIKELHDNALKNCKSLITIECDGTTPPTITGDVFKNLSVEKITLIIPASALNSYSEAFGWKDFIYNPADDNQTGGTIVIKTNHEIRDSETRFLEKPIIIEGQKTDPAYNEYNMVSYIRNFKNTNWQALYVPIELVYSDWSEKFEIAKIHSILETGDIFYAMADIVEDAITPHQLYLIRAKEIGEHTITVSQIRDKDNDGDPLYRVYTSNTSVDGTDPIIATSESFTGASGATYTFTGQYATTSLKETNHTQPPYLYAMTGGELKRPNPESATGIPLGAFRWWLEVTPPTGSQSLLFSTGKINQNGTTDINGIKINLNEIEGVDIYYNLNGCPVEKPTNGIYIKNGKKILVK